MLDLWLVRHAESIGNVDGTASDTGLSDRGRVQALALAAAVPASLFAVALCSPLVRARETAALAVPGLPVTVVPALRELESSRRPTFVDPTDPSALARLLDSPIERTESGTEFMQRVASWVQSLPSEGNVLAVTHFAVIREVVGQLLGFRSAPQRIEFTAVFRLGLSDHRCEVLAWNDTRHLEAP